MAEAFEDKYFSVLQNMEFAIHDVYTQHPELTDYQVDKVLEGLVRLYTAEQKGRPSPKLKLVDYEQHLYEAIQIICDWWLLRRTVPVMNEQGETNETENTDPKTVDEIIACLKRIRKSISLWTKERGKRGYLDFVSQFMARR
jgi:hypothetical protein